MKHLLRSILILICLMILFQVSYACTCEARSLEDEVTATEFIFVGEVTKITEDKSYVPPKIEGASERIQQIINTRKRFFIKFKIKKNYKGNEDKEITLVQYRQDSSCLGIYFDKEETYLIYAHN